MVTFERRCSRNALLSGMAISLVCHASAQLKSFTAFSPENYHYCSDVLSENQTHAERCEKIESCLEIYTVNNFQNGI